MEEVKYELLKNYESPTVRIPAGNVRTEEQWMNRFPYLYNGDCEIKTNWFKRVVIGEIKESPEIKLGISVFKDSKETYYKEYFLDELIKDSNKRQ